MTSEESYLESIREAVIDGQRGATVEATEAALNFGIDPLRVLKEGLTSGAELVGQYFEEGTFFLPQLMLAGNALRAGMEVVQPVIKERYPTRSNDDTGVVVIATVHTDVHDIGKNLVGSMLSASGFTVHDLGVDVPLKNIIERAGEVDADIIACSALLTTSAPYLRDLVQMLEDRNFRRRFSVIIGGASVNPEFAAEIGSDGTAADAVGAVRLARSLIRAKRSKS
jgi:methanogenic corrinoid protein MtbC1